MKPLTSVHGALTLGSPGQNSTLSNDRQTMQLKKQWVAWGDGGEHGEGGSPPSSGRSSGLLKQRRAYRYFSCTCYAGWNLALKEEGEGNPG